MTEASAFPERLPPALRLTVDLGALVDNWLSLRRASGRARTSAVVKADGYGLGLGPVVSALRDAGCGDFFVATIAEGVAARSVAPDARIFVLNGIYAGAEAAVRDADLVPVLASDSQLALWAADCAELGPHPCAVQVDTGMNRLGLSVRQALQLADDTTRPASLMPVLVMSHLACADAPAHPMNRRQLESFQAIATAFDGIDSSLCNSAGIGLGPEFHFDLTRPGISLYGGQATTGIQNAMKPVACAEARILQIRQAKAGETVSYGAAETLQRDTRIAVCAVGYADGYHRSHSGSGVPLRAHETLPRPAGFAAGREVPVLGRITMDLTMFDITDAPIVREGDFIELFGPNMPLDRVADAAGTIGYEILTSIGGRYQRSVRNAWAR